MISVIIPVYNAANTLDRCLHSLLRSDFEETGFEIIVVDDCSTDISAQIARSYPCRVLTLDRNSGAGIARNLGSMHALGEILFFIDADVFVEPDVLRKIDSAFRNSPEIDALVGAYLPWQPNDNFYSQYQTSFTYYNHELCPEGKIYWFWGACGAIRKEVFETIGRFDEKYVGAGAEDIELGYDLSDGGHAILLDKSIGVVHCHRHSFRSIILNNLKKSSEWCTLYLTKNIQNRYKHGFTSWRNGFTIILTWIAFFLAGLYVIGFDTKSWLFLILTGLTVINWDFYRCLHNQYGKVFLMKAILFHWLTYFLIGIGVLKGVLRYLFSTEPKLRVET